MRTPPIVMRDPRAEDAAQVSVVVRREVQRPERSLATVDAADIRGLATARLRCSVSGVAIVASSRKVARPTRCARAASRRRSSSVRRRRRSPRLQRRRRLSSIRVRDRLPLPAVQPAGEHAQHHLQRRGVDHEPELNITGRPERRRPSRGTLRPALSPIRQEHRAAETRDAGSRQDV